MRSKPSKEKKPPTTVSLICHLCNARDHKGLDAYLTLHPPQTVDFNISFDDKNYTEATFLHFAVFNCRLKLMTALLKHGANPNKQATYMGSIHTPLQICLRKHALGTFACARIALALLTRGAQAKTLSLEHYWLREKFVDLRVMTARAILSMPNKKKLQYLNWVFAGTTGDQQTETELGKFLRRETEDGPVSVANHSFYRELNEDWLKLKPPTLSEDPNEWETVLTDSLAPPTAEEFGGKPGDVYGGSEAASKKKTGKVKGLPEDVQMIRMDKAAAPAAAPTAPAKNTSAFHRFFGFRKKKEDSTPPSAPSPSAPGEG